jgi:hypothetical protein
VVLVCALLCVFFLCLVSFLFFCLLLQVCCPLEFALVLHGEVLLLGCLLWLLSGDWELPEVRSLLCLLVSFPVV